MNAPLRITLVGPLPPPAGGMANQTRQLKRLLEGEGMQVDLVQTNPPFRPAWVSSVRGLRAAFRLAPYLWTLWWGTARTDVVHVMANSGLAWDLFAAPAIIVAKLRGRPVVVNYRGGLAEDFLSHAAARVTRALRGTRLVVPSNYLREVFGRFGLRAEVVPNVVDVGLFQPATDRRVAIDPAAPRVLIARNLEHIYGIDLGLRAVAILRREWPRMRVAIAGSGPEREALESMVRELGLDEVVEFTGRLDSQQMASRYQQADLVLNPVRADNAPNSVLEALACGVPVVSTRVGGVPYLVEHERTAVLVDPESPEALAHGVRRVVLDERLRRTMIGAGLALARDCSWPRVRHMWFDVYGVGVA